ncbi:MAG: ATP-binding protein, partial [Chloroflexi bacterium]|nr:ATP-binding protein [Chloroflexota bacterium]
MIGEKVEHPQFGPGQVVAVYRNGAELMVRFANGLRFRRPRHEFVKDGQALGEPKPAFAVTYEPPPPMNQSQREARQLVESLRVGIAPAQHVPELTIDLKAERESLVQALNQAHQQGGAVRAVVGEYGYGKSHIVELTTQEALARNFLVAPISLDLLELPPHRPFDIYREAMSHLRYPDSDERGLEFLLEKTADPERTIPQLRDLSSAGLDPLVVGLQALANTASSRQRQAWTRWLMGGRRVSI